MADVKAVKRYNVWITTERPTFVDELITRLVKRGFNVGPLGRTLKISRPETTTSVISLDVFRSPRDDDETKEYTPTGIYAEVNNILTICNGKFTSIVIAEAGSCTWNHGNSSAEDELAERIKLTN